MSCSVCACQRFSQHVWRKNKCNECFHPIGLHQGVTVGDDGNIYIDGILSVPDTQINSPTSSSMSSSNAAAVASPIRDKQNAFSGGVVSPKGGTRSVHDGTGAGAPPSATTINSEGERVQMVTSPAAAQGRKFAAPGSSAPPKAAQPPSASKEPQYATLAIPAHLEAGGQSAGARANAAAAAGNGAGSKPSSKPSSKPGSKSGSRRGSASKIPGMIAEEKPYGVKALYSHVGSIPEQLSFKRNELLLIDGHMEGWFSASVIGQPERRGWIPNNYVQRDDSIVIPAAQQKKSKSRRGSAMNPTAAAALNGSAAAAADAPKRGSISVSSTAPSTVEPTHSPGPTIGHMSSAHHVHAQGESANKPVLLEALYDFVAEHPDQQLSFQKGDVFILHNKDDPDWFDVKNQETGQIGAVPALYLRELINVDQQVVREVMQQEKDAAAGESASSSSNPNHLTLQTGDTGGKSNLPEASPLASGAQAVSSTPMAAPTPIAGAPTPLGASPAGASSSPIPEEATHRAAYSFTASAAGQLSYAKGDLFQLLSKDHEGWHRFKHFASGMQGLVATNYVKAITSEEKSASALSSSTPASAAAATEADAVRIQRESEAAAAVAQAAQKAASDAAAEAERTKALLAAEQAAAAEQAQKHAADQAAEAEAEKSRKLAAEQAAAAEAEAARAKQEADQQEALARKKQEELLAAEQLAAEAAAEEKKKAQKQQEEEAAAATAARTTSGTAAAATASSSASAFPVHLALYDFPATAAGQVSLTKGDLLEVLEKGDHGWWSVKTSKGETGMAPANYIRDTPEAAKETAAAGGAATPAHRASVTVNTSTSASSPAPSPSASTRGASLSGSFNPTHIGSVGYMSPSEQARRQSAVLDSIVEMGGQKEGFTVLPKASPSSSASAASSRQTALALYAFAGTVAGQLSFSKDSVLTVLAQPEHGWFRAKDEKSGEEGSVPENYFKIDPIPAASAGAGLETVSEDATADPPTITVTTPSHAGHAASEGGATKTIFTPSNGLPPGGRRGTVAGGGAGGPPPVPKDLADHMKRHSVISSGSAQGESILAAGKPLAPLSGAAASAGGPPALSQDLAEHVKRMSISNGSAPAGAGSAPSPLAAAPTPHASSTPMSSSSSSSSSDIPAGATHRAAYAFVATAPGQLSYAKGDYLGLVSKDHEGWWRFRKAVGGEEGLVASNYVKELTPEQVAAAAASTAATPSAAAAASVAATAAAASTPASAAASTTAASTTSSVRHLALYDFPATAAGQVSLTKGDLLEVLEKGEHGWWSVKTSKGETGMAPANYIKDTPEAASAGATEATTKTASPVKPDSTSTAAAVTAASARGTVSGAGSEAVALYDYTAQGANQLTISRGQKLTIRDGPSADWVSAQSLDGSAGIIPLSYCARVIGRVRTLYAFARDVEKDLLGFQAGEVIRVTERNDETSWGTGWLEEKPETGLYPLNYVEPM